MPKFTFEILAKKQDPTEIRALYNAEIRIPKMIIMKRVGEFQTDYLLCVPYSGDTYDRPADRFMFLDIPHREDVADQDGAEDVRGGTGDMDGLVLEHTNVGGDVSIYSDDGDFIHDQIAGSETVESDGSHSDDGGHRAREGWNPAQQIKPGSCAFNDYKKGSPGAEEAGFGNPLN